MQSKRWLYGLIAADVVLAFTTIGVESVLQKFLPPSLREAQVGSWLGTGGTWVGVEFVIWTLSLGLFLLAWVGLVRFVRGSREIYLVAWALTLFSLALRGPSVLSAAGTVLDTAGTLVSGALMALVWFSDLAPRYRTTAVAATGPGRSIAAVA